MKANDWGVYNGSSAVLSLKVPTEFPFISSANHSTRSTNSFVLTPEIVIRSSKQISSSVGNEVISGNPTTLIVIVSVISCVAQGSSLLKVAEILIVPSELGSKVGVNVFPPWIINPSEGSTLQVIL